MRKNILILLLFVAQTAFAQNQNGKISAYGEISNHAALHSRIGITDDIGVFYLLPVDEGLNEVGLDLNDVRTFNFLSIASRAGMAWSGFSNSIMKADARLDGDFYCASGSSCVLRVRNAYFNTAFDFGRFGRLNVLAGQTKHPLAEDCPHVFTLNTGAPFNPYNYSPQLKAEYSYFPWMSVTLAALWQTSNTSTGPAGKSVKYINWGCTPELYGGLTFRYKNLMAKVGVDFLSIKPRREGYYPYTTVIVPVTDRINNYSPYVYAEYHGNNWCVKGKSVLASSGEHLTMMGGYAIYNAKYDGSYTYTPYRNSSSWVSGEYLYKDLSGSLMLGYIRNLGPDKTPYSEDYIYFYADAWNLQRAVRIAPTVKYSYKHFTAGLCYEYTAAQYTNWVCDHGFTLLLSCKF